jgi:phage terminase Nu1 subunit (DNA packaging protein)
MKSAKPAESAAMKEWKKPCTASELAYQFRCDVRTIQDLANKGVVVRLDRNLYDSWKSTQRYIRHLQEEAAKRQGCTVEELLDRICR